MSGTILPPFKPKPPRFDEGALCAQIGIVAAPEMYGLLLLERESIPRKVNCIGKGKYPVEGKVYVVNPSCTYRKYAPSEISALRSF